MNKKTYIFAHQTARKLAADECMKAPDGYVCEIKPATRNLEQNAKLHALFEELEKSGIKWAGKERSAAEWKVLMVSGHAIATGEGAEVVAGIEGEFVNIRESTALMSKKRGSSLIEYTEAFFAQNGII